MNARKQTFFYISPKNDLHLEKDLDETKYKYFLIKDDELLEKQ